MNDYTFGYERVFQATSRMMTLATFKSQYIDRTEGAAVLLDGTLVVPDAEVLTRASQLMPHLTQDMVRPGPNESSCTVIRAKLKDGFGQVYVAVEHQPIRPWDWSLGDQDGGLSFIADTALSYDPITRSKLMKFVRDIGATRTPVHGKMHTKDYKCIPYPTNGVMIATERIGLCKTGIHATWAEKADNWLSFDGGFESVQFSGLVIRGGDKICAQIAQFETDCNRLVIPDHEQFTYLRSEGEPLNPRALNKTFGQVDRSTRIALAAIYGDQYLDYIRTVNDAWSMVSGSITDFFKRRLLDPIGAVECFVMAEKDRRWTSPMYEAIRADFIRVYQHQATHDPNGLLPDTFAAWLTTVSLAEHVDPERAEPINELF